MQYTDMITEALDAMIDMKNGVSTKALKKRCRHNEIFSTLHKLHRDKESVLSLEAVKKSTIVENEVRVRLKNYIRFNEIVALVKDKKLDTEKKIEQALVPFVSKLDEVEREAYQYVLSQPASAKAKKQEVKEIVIEPEQELETVLVTIELEE